MKRLIKYILIIVLCLMVIPVKAQAKTVDVYFFRGEGCPHCAKEEQCLKKYKKNKNVKIHEYEVWYSEENSELLQKVKERMNVESTGVPFTVIGSHYIIGYNDSMGDEIKRAITYYQKHEYKDITKEIINDTLDENYEIIDKFAEEEKKTDKELSIDTKVFGKINVKKISVFMAAVLIGLVDGFNPCAMWILLFLLSILIGMKDKKKMWTYGLAFLLTSAFVYMLIMFSWINIVVKITTSILIRNIIAVVALIGGGLNIYNYIKSKDNGCNVVDDKKRKKIFSKIKNFTSSKSFIIGLIGIIGLAISVNLVELACSAGLPLVFTELLTLNNITGMKSLLYVLVYILFFLLDDLIVFFIAMFTMKMTGISTKFNKYSHIIGAIFMISIGLLMLFKPDWLMFNFK